MRPEADSRAGLRAPWGQPCPRPFRDLAAGLARLLGLCAPAGAQGPGHSLPWKSAAVGGRWPGPSGLWGRSGPLGTSCFVLVEAWGWESGPLCAEWVSSGRGGHPRDPLTAVGCWRPCLWEDSSAPPRPHLPGEVPRTLTPAPCPWVPWGRPFCPPRLATACFPFLPLEWRWAGVCPLLGRDTRGLGRGELEGYCSLFMWLAYIVFAELPLCLSLFVKSVSGLSADRLPSGVVAVAAAGHADAGRGDLADRCSGGHEKSLRVSPSPRAHSVAKPGPRPVRLGSRVRVSVRATRGPARSSLAVTEAQVLKPWWVFISRTSRWGKRLGGYGGSVHQQSPCPPSL